MLVKRGGYGYVEVGVRGKSLKALHNFIVNLKLLFKKKIVMDVPGGTVNKHLPANAGDMGLIPGLERFHMLRSN